MVCDAMAAETVAGRENYARSLLRLASLLVHGTPARTLHAIGIFDANIFERRVMNLTEKYVELRGVRRLATAKPPDNVLSAEGHSVTARGGRVRPKATQVSRGDAPVKREPACPALRL